MSFDVLLNAEEFFAVTNHLFWFSHYTTKLSDLQQKKKKNDTQETHQTLPEKNFFITTREESDQASKYPAVNVCRSCHIHPVPHHI